MSACSISTTWLPSYYEVQVTVKVGSGGAQANGFIIFDYQERDQLQVCRHRCRPIT